MKITLALLIAAVLLSVPAIGQTNLNFNNVAVTTEGAIRLSWNSASNEYYRVDYADSLVDTNTGSITWNTLYDDYVSQGTSTFWLDTGNYFNEPPILHPGKTTQRYYRIALLGTNDVPAPYIAITSPTNGSFLSGDATITVAANSDQPFITTKLYVDGEEMQEANTTTNYTDNGTNYVIDTYVINTCEWPNEPHKLFATAHTESGPSGAPNVAAVQVGRAASAMVPVTFGNLITRISFSEPFFAPEDGTTQHVSAVFAANVDWTLQIQDASSNTVRTATGGGGSMHFDWDGTGEGGTNLPIGTYTYLITAQTNGQSLAESDGGESSSAMYGSSTTEESGETRLWVERPSGVTVPLALYPPGIDTNGWDIFEAPASWNPWLESLSSQSTSTVDSGGDSGGAPLYSGPSFQSSRAPVRPPTVPVKGRAGTFGIAYDTYRGVFSGYSLQAPDNGLHIGVRIQLQGFSGDYHFVYPVLWGHIGEAGNFIREMRRGNWSMGFDRYDDALSINDLRASGANIFNNVKLGLLMCHGVYGTSQDYTANGCKEMYFPITSGSSAQYLRMSEMNLGNADTNGLKWMAIAACNSLYHTDWQNMQNNGITPANGNLHLILGTDTLAWTGPTVMSLWAKYMTKGKTNNSPMTIESAWYAGPGDSYLQSGFNYTNAIKFAAAGDFNCRDDYLLTNAPPAGSPFYNSQQVWP